MGNLFNLFQLKKMSNAEKRPKTGKKIQVQNRSKDSFEMFRKNGQNMTKIQKSAISGQKRP